MTILSKRTAAACGLLIGSLLLSSCTSGIRAGFLNQDAVNFSARFWKTPRLGRDYPEMSEPHIKNRPSFGVAFQGGGNRAAPAALGQLRALHELKWIDDLRYITAISGGSWTAIPYTYLKQGKAADGATDKEDIFLGQSYAPDDLARLLPLIEKDKNGALDNRYFPPGSMLGAMADATVAKKMIRAWLGGTFDEAYSRVLESIYLEPFDLGRPGDDTPDELFTWRDEDRDEIRKNARFRHGPRIHIVERQRPYLIVGGTLLTQRGQITPDKKFRTEMTPLYSGAPFEPRFKKTGIRVGGGFVESFGYDYVTRKVDRQGAKIRLTLSDPQYGNRTDRHRLNFSFANMAAVSGAAPVETMISQTPTTFVVGNVGFPEHFVPIDQPAVPYQKIFHRAGEIYEKEWSQGDGGHEDKLGLAPLLSRQVENIIVFANAFSGLDKDAIKDCDRALDEHTADRGANKLPEAKNMKACLRAMIGGDLPSFFVQTESYAHNIGLRMRNNPAPGSSETLRGYRDLLTLAKELRDKHSVSCRRYDYTPNDSAVGVSYSPMICIVYLDLDEEWIGPLWEAASEAEKKTLMEVLDLNRSGTSVQNGLNKTGFGHGSFPHLGTFFDQRLRVIKTRKARLFALSNLTEWKLRKYSGTIRKSFQRNGLMLD